MAVDTAWSAVRRALFWIVPLALLATFVWTLLPRGRTAAPSASETPVPAAGAPAQSPGDGAPPPAETPNGAKPYAQIQQGDLTGTDAAGRQQWRIVAEAVTLVQNKETVLLRNVRATFFQKDGGTITVTGSKGRYDTKTQGVVIDGDVHGKSSNGRELFADQLQWVPKSGRITGVGHIRLVQERVTMYADRMISDTTLGQTQFFGHVHAAVR